MYNWKINIKSNIPAKSSYIINAWIRDMEAANISAGNTFFAWNTCIRVTFARNISIGHICAEGVFFIFAYIRIACSFKSTYTWGIYIRDTSTYVSGAFTEGICTKDSYARNVFAYARGIYIRDNVFGILLPEVFLQRMFMLEIVFLLEIFALSVLI